MIKKIIGIILGLGIALAIWRIWGNDGGLVVLLNNIWSFFVIIVEAVAVFAGNAIQTILGWFAS